MHRSALALAALSFALFAAPALAAPGDLDPSFDGDGRQLHSGSPGVPLDALVQPDGKTVLAGYDTNDDAAVWRLNPDGSPDRGFDGDGVAAIDFGTEDKLWAVARQPDGRLVVAGQTRGLPDGADMAIARLNTDGSLDRTFAPGGDDGDGKKVIATSDDIVATTVVVQADGRILLAGRGTFVGAFSLWRLTSTGADSGSGFDAPVNSKWEYALDALQQPDGKIVLAGEAMQEGKWVSAVARYTLDGKLDDSFGEKGVQLLPDLHAVRVRMRPNGKLLVAANAVGPDTKLLVTQLKEDGEVDADFGDDGTAAADFEGRSLTWDIAVQPDGSAIVAGTATAGPEFAVARFTTTGALDAGFGTGGRTTVAFGVPSQLTGAALQPDGRLVLAGLAGATVPSPAVARLLTEEAAPGGPALPTTPVVLRCAGRRATIVGTARRDRLVGTRRADVIVALGGNDRVLARGGNDVVCGGGGADRLDGGRGRDLLRGGAGRDRCVGAAGRDRAGGCERRRSI